MEYAKGLMDIPLTHLQIPFKKNRLLLRNLLFFFPLDLINFLKLKWWWGSWSCFFFNCYKVLIFMFNGILACSNIFKSDLYVTNIEVWAPINRYSFIVQSSINRCSLVHVHSRMCLRMIFNSFKGVLFILMWCFLIFSESLGSKFQSS